MIGCSRSLERRSLGVPSPEAGNQLSSIAAFGEYGLGSRRHRWSTASAQPVAVTLAVSAKARVVNQPTSSWSFQKITYRSRNGIPIRIAYLSAV